MLKKTIFLIIFINSFCFASDYELTDYITNDNKTVYYNTEKDEYAISEDDAFMFDSEITTEIKQMETEQE